MEDEELLPKWFSPVDRDIAKANRFIKWFLLVTLAIFTLGVSTAIQHTIDGTKGK